MQLAVCTDKGWRNGIMKRIKKKQIYLLCDVIYGNACRKMGYGRNDGLNTLSNPEIVLICS